ncbi:mannose-6-phosphate isomerase class I [Dysgonomonas alginatilytica]|uniref:Mannose-6-phosphate isomerase class I n=1 Tax=Dysgonomonas alginatilytica TaxID=1605892 RepID=A0A2V3PLJ4_9BACT|nr:class I mannose-6-phosphate isomerase [Dysgonomonas alginatilytica]PXV59989.1 mannose-6-phosphate isomerase class I [Dysgonomonas alginatilytica]
MRKSNYEKFPSTKVDGTLINGWHDILCHLKELIKTYPTIAIELYSGVIEEEIFSKINEVAPALLYNTRDMFKPESEVSKMTERFMTEDVLFGYVTNLSIIDYFDKGKLEKAKQEIIGSKTPVIVIGSGSSLVVPESACIIYIDMARWEIIQRFRCQEVSALGIDDRKEPVSIQYKRGYFNDWKILDRHKDSLFQKVSYWIDTHIQGSPKMIDKATFLDGIQRTIERPFRVVPFFDPAPWGGQWMKEVCGLDKDRINFGWCFDCVPEENSLLLNVNGTSFEMPSINLVLLKSRELLGEPVESRFGKEFPIRFDFLDTIGGGNLSLQVHPTVQFIRDSFGMFYTQDESYYMVDVKEGATVYLGLKNGIDQDEMINDLQRAERGEIIFDADKYVNKIPAKKHDHFLIPGGTIHCSGSEGVVLEISSTPNLFTFKLWDWERLGLDGKPRPINVERGKEVIDWSRDTDYTYANLVNTFSVVAEGEGWIEEKTGLHPNEFIETRRHRFCTKVVHNTNNSVNVLNLLEGEEVIVESPDNKFEPFVVHYAETFIIPASIGKYSIAPYGKSEGKECITIKANVRF